ncbi:MAG: hypothetical protein ACE5OR_17770 [bacterium]
MEEQEVIMTKTKIMKDGKKENKRKIELSSNFFTRGYRLRKRQPIVSSVLQHGVVILMTVCYEELSLDYPPQRPVCVLRTGRLRDTELFISDCGMRIAEL